MDSYFSTFTKYINDKYDINDPIISDKYYHSIRVCSLMICLSLKLGLLNDDLLLAAEIGLFHDLGRFREVVRNKNKDKKLNNMNFDHGAYSNKILFNDGLIKMFNVNSNDYLVIKKALFYHNKKDIGHDLNEKELFFVWMIRDMDKLDILYQRSFKRHLKFDDQVNEKILLAFFNDETISIADLKSDSDRVIFYLSFIKDLHFDESFDLAINNGYLNLFMNIIEVKNNDLFNQLMEKVYERRNKNVRKKI